MSSITGDLIQHTYDIDSSDILCASISCWDIHLDTAITINLQIGGDESSFYKRLTMGSNTINDATVWYTDGTWSTYERDYTYDRMDGYWSYHRCPDIPKYLHNNESELNAFESEHC